MTFSPLTDGDIRFYVASREPMDKAGGYGIQGMASRWITRIEGDYSTLWDYRWRWCGGCYGAGMV